MGNVSENIVSFLMNHGLRTPNEGMNETYVKNWAYVADIDNMLRQYLKIWD